MHLIHRRKPWRQLGSEFAMYNNWKWSWKEVLIIVTKNIWIYYWCCARYMLHFVFSQTEVFLEDFIAHITALLLPISASHKLSKIQSNGTLLCISAYHFPICPNQAPVQIKMKLFSVAHLDLILTKIQGCEKWDVQLHLTATQTQNAAWACVCHQLNVRQEVLDLFHSASVAAVSHRCLLQRSDRSCQILFWRPFVTIP